MDVYPLELEIDLVRDSEHDVVLVQRRDTPKDSRAGNHLIALVQCGHHLGVFFLALALRPDGYEVEQNEQSDQEQDLEQLAAAGLRAGRLGMCTWDQEIHREALLSSEFNILFYSVIYSPPGRCSGPGGHSGPDG